MYKNHEEIEELSEKDLTVEQIQKRCFQNAKALGWAEQEITIPEMIALIHSEVSEALEAFRHGEPVSHTDCSGKPQGIASEFADIVIRVMHYSEILGIDLQTEILRKLTFNLTRGYRHGGLKI